MVIYAPNHLCTYAHHTEYAIARPSVCRLSVTLVRPTQPVETVQAIVRGGRPGGRSDAMG